MHAKIELSSNGIVKIAADRICYCCSRSVGPTCTYNAYNNTFTIGLHKYTWLWKIMLYGDPDPPQRGRGRVGENFAISVPSPTTYLRNG